MLLYVCSTCGRWRDVSIGVAINDIASKWGQAFALEFSQEIAATTCPAGHGLMVHVQTTDRVYVRSGEVEAMVEKTWPDVATSVKWERCKAPKCDCDHPCDEYLEAEQQGQAIDEIARISQEAGMYD